MNAPLPANEGPRLQALRRYAILDTRPEAEFDRITRLVARLLKVPVVLVTLVDEDRQWFKSSCGVQVSETGREVSFCAHTILGNEVMVIPDATGDERFRNNPLVTGEPHVRFYAGAPIRSIDGFNLGSLCAIDIVPRQFSAEERELLSDLAAIVADELELRLAMRERHQHAIAIFNLDSGVVMTDPSLPDNPIVLTNPGFSKMTGYLADEMVGRNCRFLQGPETDRKTLAGIRDAIADRRTFQGEILNYRKDGSRFWNELTISPVFDGSGDLISYVGLQTDVTERKQASDNLRQSYAKLKELETLKDDLTHMIIHDLRSPLTTVLGYLDLVQMKAEGSLPREGMQYIEQARDGAARLQEMITSLLDVNRLEAGEMPLDMRETDLREIVAAASDPFRPLIGNRSLVQDLPPTPMQARCDPSLMRRVITNLLSNAIKFAPPTGEIRVAVAPRNDRLAVSVSDNGPGIPAEYHDRIFEKFGQVDGILYQHSTGLGLTFCKLAIEAQGGTIGVESVPGQGTTFWFTI